MKSHSTQQEDGVEIQAIETDTVLTDLASAKGRVHVAIADLESARADEERAHAARLAGIDARLTALREALNVGNGTSPPPRSTCPGCLRTFTYIRNLARHKPACRGVKGSKG